MLASVAEREAVDAILSYCRYNLLVSDLDSVLTPVASSNGIGLINASPLHMGLLAVGQPSSWHPAPKEVMEVASQIVDFCVARGLDPSVVALNFSLKHPYVSSTLVGMSTRQHVNTNLKALDQEISLGVRAAIEQIAASAKNVIWRSGRSENADETSFESQVQAH